MRVPGITRRTNQSILKEISPESSLEELMLKLKLQYFGHLMPRIDSLEKTLMLGKIEGGRKRGLQRMRWLDGITDSMDMSSVQFSSVAQRCLTLCDPWTAACQASLSITNYWSLLKFMPIELVRPSNHLILCHPLLLPHSVFPRFRVFSNESALPIRLPKY